MNKEISEKTQELEKIKQTIETYTEKQQEDVLNILKEDNLVTINENKNGFFINLSDISDVTLTKINKYIEYVLLQEKHLTNMEEKTKEYEECLNS